MNVKNIEDIDLTNGTIYLNFDKEKIIEFLRIIERESQTSKKILNELKDIKNLLKRKQTYKIIILTMNKEKRDNWILAIFGLVVMFAWGIANMVKYT